MISFGGLAGHQVIAISASASSKWPHCHCCFRWVQSFHQVTRSLAESLQLTTRARQTQVHKRAEVGSGQRTRGEQQCQKPRRESSQHQPSFWSPASPLPDLPLKAGHTAQRLKPLHPSRASTATFPCCEDACFLSPAP